jgi:large subunit ribosomal protein L7Ae
MLDYYEQVKRGAMMAKSSYVKFETPKEVLDKAMELVKISKETGKIAKGANEVTKMVERSEAKLVVIAEDVQPPEVVEHIPMLCDEKNIPYVYIQTKEELGKLVGILKSASAVAILSPGQGEEKLKKLVEDIKNLKR